ncbi:MAG: UPF0149 family protein [Marinobacterium sp.]|nr:UPF0149 family protein [Marinobacterium sp.]
MSQENSAQTTSLPIDLPDFDLIANLFVQEGVQVVSPSELHGLFCGHLAAGARSEPGALLRSACELMDITALQDEASKIGVLALYQCALAQLQSTDMSFQLLLPDDDSELSERVTMLGAWCTGFLSGFGLQGAHSNTTLSKETRETLKDLGQIAQIESDIEDNDENEADMMEVQEYVRMACLMLFTECNTVADAAQPAPTVH